MEEEKEKNEYTNEEKKEEEFAKETYVERLNQEKEEIRIEQEEEEKEEEEEDSCGSLRILANSACVRLPGRQATGYPEQTRTAAISGWAWKAETT